MIKEKFPTGPLQDIKLTSLSTQDPTAKRRSRFSQRTTSTHNTFNYDTITQSHVKETIEEENNAKNMRIDGAPNSLPMAQSRSTLSSNKVNNHQNQSMSSISLDDSRPLNVDSSSDFDEENKRFVMSLTEEQAAKTLEDLTQRLTPKHIEFLKNRSKSTSEYIPKTKRKIVDPVNVVSSSNGSSLVDKRFDMQGRLFIDINVLRAYISGLIQKKLNKKLMLSCLESMTNLMVEFLHKGFIVRSDITDIEKVESEYVNWEEHGLSITHLCELLRSDAELQRVLSLQALSQIFRKRDTILALSVYGRDLASTPYAVPGSLVDLASSFLELVSGFKSSITEGWNIDSAELMDRVASIVLEVYNVDLPSTIPAALYSNLAAARMSFTYNLAIIQALNSYLFNEIENLVALDYWNVAGVASAHGTPQLWTPHVARPNDISYEIHMYRCQQEFSKLSDSILSSSREGYQNNSESDDFVLLCRLGAVEAFLTKSTLLDLISKLLTDSLLLLKSSHDNRILSSQYQISSEIVQLIARLVKLAGDSIESLQSTLLNSNGIIDKLFSSFSNLTESSLFDAVVSQWRLRLLEVILEMMCLMVVRNKNTAYTLLSKPNITAFLQLVYEKQSLSYLVMRFLRVCLQSDKSLLPTAIGIVILPSTPFPRTSSSISDISEWREFVLLARVVLLIYSSSIVSNSQNIDKLQNVGGILTAALVKVDWAELASDSPLYVSLIASSLRLASEMLCMRKSDPQWYVTSRTIQNIITDLSSKVDELSKLLKPLDLLTHISNSSEIYSSKGQYRYVLALKDFISSIYSFLNSQVDLEYNPSIYLSLLREELDHSKSIITVCACDGLYKWGVSRFNHEILIQIFQNLHNLAPRDTVYLLFETSANINRATRNSFALKLMTMMLDSLLESLSLNLDESKITIDDVRYIFSLIKEDYSTFEDSEYKSAGKSWCSIFSLDLQGTLYDIISNDAIHESDVSINPLLLYSSLKRSSTPALLRQMLLILCEVESSQLLDQLIRPQDKIASVLNIIGTDYQNLWNVNEFDQPYNDNSYIESFQIEIAILACNLLDQLSKKQFMALKLTLTNNDLIGLKNVQEILTQAVMVHTKSSGTRLSSSSSQHVNKQRLESESFDILANRLIDGAIFCSIDSHLHSASLSILISYSSPWRIRDLVWRKLSESGLTHLLDEWPSGISWTIAQAFLVKPIAVMEESTTLSRTIATALSQLKSENDTKSKFYFYGLLCLYFSFFQGSDASNTISGQRARLLYDLAKPDTEYVHSMYGANYGTKLINSILYLACYLQLDQTTGLLEKLSTSDNVLSVVDDLLLSWNDYESSVDVLTSPLLQNRVKLQNNEYILGSLLRLSDQV